MKYLQKSKHPTWEQNMKAFQKSEKKIKRNTKPSQNSEKVTLKEKIKSLKTPLKEKNENKKKNPNSKIKKSVLKNILIVVLVVALIGESVALVISSTNKTQPVSSDVQPTITLNLQMGEIGNDVSSAVSSLIGDFSQKGVSTADILNLVKGVVYSDNIVNVIMSMAYPLLFETLTTLEMMDFATNIDLYPTPVLYTEVLGENTYTCCDKDGTRKALNEVLTAADTDWSYMDAQVSWTDTDGTAKTTSLWNSINWGVNGKDSFYKAMEDMSAGLRGVLEICVQGKSRLVNINVVDFLLNTDAININLEAATIYNSSEKSGYEACLVLLFNTLGLIPGEYPSVEDACSYTALGDIWKAILEPVLFAVEKAMNDPVQNLTSMLINFADVIETGELCKGMSYLRIDAEFHRMATAFMGFESGLLFNLGDSLINIIGELGLDISGSFNSLLDGLLKKITKSSSADMPSMDINALRECAVKTTLSNGNKHYVAIPEKTVDFLIEYVVNENIIESVLALTPLAGTEEANTIVAAIGQSKEGLTTIAQTLISLLLGKLEEITA